MTKLDSLIIQYRSAVARLGEILNQEKNPIVRDAAIKRFE